MYYTKADLRRMVSDPDIGMGQLIFTISLEEVPDDLQEVWGQAQAILSLITEKLFDIPDTPTQESFPTRPPLQQEQASG